MTMTAQIRKTRVGIVGICHESNTFIPESTTLLHFHRGVFLRGEQIRVHYSKGHHEITGFLEVLDQAGIEAVPLFYAYAPPWGSIKKETCEALWQTLAHSLEDAGPLDGILAAPHGAAVGVTESDLDGWWLTRLRAKVGNHIPIMVTLDPHANLSPAMIAMCQALVAYRENPHLDQRQRGAETAQLMVRTLRGEVRPISAGSFPPVAINIERQLTACEPMLSIHRKLEEVRALPGVLSASVTLGFPYADVSDMGSAFVVVTDHDPKVAQEQADHLAQWLIEHRELFRPELISAEAALEKALHAPKPVGLLDMGDNTGGGAPGDSTVLAHLCQQRPDLRTLFYVPDADSVQAAKEASLGNRVSLKFGGKLPMTPAPPVETAATVIGLYDGTYAETQPRHGGATGGDMGTTVVVRTDSGLTIMLMSRREVGVNFSVQPLISCNLKPADFDVIIIKGVHAPVGAYAAICPTLIRVNTPGVTTADMEALPYKKRRKPLFPFEANIPELGE